MNVQLQRIITTVAALAVTGLAVVMASASAPIRASSPTAAAIVGSFCIFAVGVAHLAPVLLRSAPQVVRWSVWAVALAAALWAHATFLTSTAADASAARQASSPAAAAAAAQRAAVDQALTEIKARPAATIARQLSWTTDPARVAALQVELQEARRGDALREQRIVLAGAATAAATAAAADPLTAAVASALGVSQGAVQLAVSLLLALLLEVTGMLLWREVAAGRAAAPSVQNTAQAAAPQAQASVQSSVQQIVQVTVQPAAPAAAQHVHPELPELVQTHVHETAPLLADATSDDVSRLRAAIRAGVCVPTVQGIRQYMRCGQVRARELRRSLDESLTDT